MDGSCLSGLEEGRRRTWCERPIGYRMSLVETTGVVTNKVVVVEQAKFRGQAHTLNLITEVLFHY